jgi:hypothetical protein
VKLRPFLPSDMSKNEQSLLENMITVYMYIYFYIAEHIFELTNCENKSLRESHLFNLQIFLFRVLYNDARKCL